MTAWILRNSVVLTNMKLQKFPFFCSNSHTLTQTRKFSQKESWNERLSEGEVKGPKLQIKFKNCFVTPSSPRKNLQQLEFSRTCIARKKLIIPFALLHFSIYIYNFFSRRSFYSANQLSFRSQTSSSSFIHI